MLLPSGIQNANHVACEIYMHALPLADADIKIINMNQRKRFFLGTITLPYFSIFPEGLLMSIYVLWLGSLPFQSPPLSLANEEENVSFVMRCLVLLWCIFSQTWRNLVIHQLFSSKHRVCLFNFSLDEIVAHFFFSIWFYLASFYSFENTSESNR